MRKSFVYFFSYLETSENLECQLKLVGEVNSEKSIHQSNGKLHEFFKLGFVNQNFLRIFSIS